MTCWAELLSRWSLVSGSNLYECHCELTEIVGHFFFIMLNHHRGIKSSFIYYGNELKMMIMLKQRKTFLGLFFPMSNKRIPGIDFDIIICLLPKTFTGSNIFFKNFGKKYCLT